jgi:hypothetical protein
MEFTAFPNLLFPWPAYPDLSVPGQAFQIFLWPGLLVPSLSPGSWGAPLHIFGSSASRPTSLGSPATSATSLGPLASRTSHISNFPGQQVLISLPHLRDIWGSTCISEISEDPPVSQRYLRIHLYLRDIWGSICISEISEDPPVSQRYLRIHLYLRDPWSASLHIWDPASQISEIPDYPHHFSENPDMHFTSQRSLIIYSIHSNPFRLRALLKYN